MINFWYLEMTKIQSKITKNELESNNNDKNNKSIQRIKMTSNVKSDLNWLKMTLKNKKWNW